MNITLRQLTRLRLQCQTSYFHISYFLHYFKILHTLRHIITRTEKSIVQMSLMMNGKLCGVAKITLKFDTASWNLLVKMYKMQITKIQKKYEANCYLHSNIKQERVIDDRTDHQQQASANKSNHVIRYFKESTFCITFKRGNNYLFKIQMEYWQLQNYYLSFASEHWGW